MAEFRATAAIGHVFRSTFGNLGFAFRMSWPWMVFILVVQVATIRLFPNLHRALISGDVEELLLSPQLVILVAVTLVTSLVAFSSIAVSWHRYILLDEEPKGWDRLRLDAPVMRHIGNLFLGQLILTGLFLAGGFAVVAVGSLLYVVLTKAVAGVVVGLMMLALWLYFVVFSQRLFIKLPAVAIEREAYGFREALADTQGHDLSLLGFVLLFALMILLLVFAIAIPAGAVSLLLGREGFTAQLATALIQFAANWIAVIMSVTSLTTLYGIFAEGRQV